jgi:fructose-1,6-bisphosphatase II / sedoheptulose-1,7-bisphosphatase
MTTITVHAGQALERILTLEGKIVETDTVVMRSATGTVRWIRAEHRHLAKFQPD